MVRQHRRRLGKRCAEAQGDHAWHTACCTGRAFRQLPGFGLLGVGSEDAENRKGRAQYQRDPWEDVGLRDPFGDRAQSGEPEEQSQPEEEVDRRNCDQVRSQRWHSHSAPVDDEREGDDKGAQAQAVKQRQANNGDD